MAKVTRRTFLGGAAATAGVAAGPWVLRAHAQSGPVKIGVVLPYTGVYAVLGESITQAMELVFARENWTVAGRKIEMIKEDDEMKPPVGIRKTEKLIDSDMMEAFKETFVPAGGKVVAEDYPKLGETDYAPYLTKIRQSGAKAVYCFFSGSDAVNFVKQFDQFGLKQSVKLTGAGFLTEPDVLPAQGRSALGVITGHFYTPVLDNPTNQRFVKEFREKFGNKMPDGFAGQGYDTAETIVRALKAVNGNTQDKEKLVAVLEKTEFDSPRGRFRFDPKSHNVIQPFIYIREVKEVAGGLNNVPIDKVADVRDPGTGCTLPA